MSDPVRLKLSADAPPLAVEALARAHGDAPDAARLLAIEAGVLGKLGLPPGGGGGGDGGAGPSAPPAGPAGTAGAAALSKAGLATLAAGAVIVAIAVATRSNAPVAPTTAATQSTTDASPAVATAASGAAPGPASISVDDLPSASAGLVSHAVASASARPPVSVPPAASDKDPAATERAEVALLADAQAALTVRPAESLARCDEHARRFATGTLVQEREVLAIDALMRLGRRPEAEARANRFRAAFPRSGHLRRIDALLTP